MLTSILTVELCGFLVAAGAIIARRLATGRITTRGLLTTRYGGADSPARMQMLLVTISCAIWYLTLVIGNPDPSQLPDVPTPLLALVGGSHATYLGAKAGDQLGALRSFFGSPPS